MPVWGARKQDRSGVINRMTRRLALDRIAAIDGWHDEQRPHSDEAA